ncbi:MAG: FUN14 domain-containing protein [Planctomycetes bacterium]|nr:FUN14 domain-containing protein [Planctomycetota bacterium]
MTLAPPITAAPTRALSSFQRLFLGATIVVLAGSVVLRVLHQSEPVGDSIATGSAFLADPPPDPGATGFERYLPHLTEASFFALIGFALGYATRKVFKLALLSIAAAFVVVQLLVTTGHVTVDWLGVRSALNQLIFNLRENETITSFLTNRIPSAGALAVGWFFGFRRG